MKLHFLGASYNYSSSAIANTVESEIIGKFRGNTYQIRRSTVITHNPMGNLKYRNLKYRGVDY